MNEVTQQEVCEKLIFPLFRCLDEGYKKKYIKDIWEQFENNMRAAAYTSSLKIFLEKITRALPIDIERQYMDGVIQVVGGGFDEEVLNWLRNETTFMTLITRSLNEERKEAKKKAQPDLFNQEPETNSINETDPLKGII